MAEPQDPQPPTVVTQGPDDGPAKLAKALALEGFKSVVVLADGHQNAPAALRPRIIQLLGRGLLRAARDAQALCVLGGGADDLLAEVLADSDGSVQLLGVAPAGLVAMPGGAPPADPAARPLAPRLKRLLLTSAGTWGAELRTKIQVAAALAGSRSGLLVVVGDGAQLMTEVREAVRQRWPVLVVRGSGAAADALADQWDSKQAVDDDPVVAEILADGYLTCITLGVRVAEAVETMTRQVLRGAGGESVLLQSWRRFAAIDRAANKQQKDFKDSQFAVLALGLVAVYLSIIYSGPADLLIAAFGLQERAELLKSALNFVLILVPIGTSVLIAAGNRFKPGKRWVLLRSAAEGIKREIYRYRLRASGYDVSDTREKKLAEAVEDITRRLARTEANTTALPIYEDEIPPRNAAHELDKGMSLLSTDQYVEWRLVDQLAFYRGKTVKLEKQLTRLQVYVLVAGAGGTLLAAVGGEAVIWITFTTALAGAVMTYLGYQQVETTLTSYNQTATDLDNILTWWTSLEPEEQADPFNLDTLVTHTERVLADELAGWTQRMTDALEKLRETQEQKDAAKREARGLPPLDPAQLAAAQAQAAAGEADAAADQAAAAAADAAADAAAAAAVAEQQAAEAAAPAPAGADATGAGEKK